MGGLSAAADTPIIAVAYHARSNPDQETDLGIAGTTQAWMQDQAGIT